MDFNNTKLEDFKDVWELASALAALIAAQAPAK